MRIEQLEYFLTIARYGSISQAANNLFIGQPTLSAAINTLEKELDTKLFKRTKAGMELTPMGEELIPMAETAIDDFYAIKKKAAKKVITKSHIHLACDASASQTAILYIVQQCKNQYPSVNLHIHEMLPSEVIRYVIEGNATIGLGSAADFLLPKHQKYANDLNLVLKQLYTDEICFCCAPTHPFAQKKSVSFLDLFDEPIAIPEGFIHQGLFKHPNSFQYFTNLCTFSNLETIKRVIIENNLIALLPKLVIKNDSYFQDGLIKISQLINHNTQYIQYLTYCRDHPLSEVEKEILLIVDHYYDTLLYPCGHPED